MTKEIVLTQGKVALVSDHRYEYLNQWEWLAAKSRKKGNWRVTRHSKDECGRKITVSMCRIILNAPKGVQVIHNDGDGLNNQDENLCLVVDQYGKRCSKCKKRKPFTDFDKNSPVRDGFSNHCKDCKSKHNRRWRGSNKTHMKSILKAWRSNHPKYNKIWRQSHPDKIAAGKRKYIIKFPEKSRARNSVQRAVRKGELPRVSSLSCIRCGCQAQEYHHHKGYAKEHQLDVVPVCNACHNIIDSS